MSTAICPVAMPAVREQGSGVADDLCLDVRLAAAICALEQGWLGFNGSRELGFEPMNHIDPTYNDLGKHLAAKLIELIRELPEDAREAISGDGTTLHEYRCQFGE